MMIYLKPNFYKAAIILLFLCFGKTIAQDNIQSEINISDKLKWSERMALSIIKRHPEAWKIDNHEAPKWDYKIGMILTAYQKLYSKTNDPKYFDYIKGYADVFIDEAGVIKKFDPQNHSLDNINTGKILFDLYNKTKEAKYLTALKTLRNNFDDYPRTPSGGFWHKKIYPNQMWLDGLYMGEPFYARYTAEFEGGEKLNDVAHQFELLHNHTFDKKTDLYFHAWDESKQMAWANKETGTAPHIWLRALGWYGMALVDALDYFPKDHPKRNELIGYVNELAVAVSKYQDKSGLWYQIPNLQKQKGNYLESSGSSMLVYFLAKGVNKGYLPVKFEKTANKGFNGLIKNLIKVDKNGEIHITQVCGSAGLGGNPYRDGSYEYYMSEKIVTDNSHGLGAFLLAAIELDK
ncbi:glycoside hydrolase family 105 protein [Flavobacterium pectinovorum]|uniref:glycoside hydrolase family 88/105 protein n=1 Tax=Flavobacterium pectinovorum TaxID=29533 RepID=UPI001FAD7926|nr:glycoside hydrolase family 88 protein [Flavobacterium pectinovorum]MCI9844695.1 glycoside hydrolase family 88 protein [Flavobacterium pectinovorum]